MTRQLSTLLALITIAAGTGCLRELEAARCPCLEGWVCCEAQNLCMPDESRCGPSPGGRSHSGDGAGAPSRAGASAQDAGAPSRAGASAQDAGEPSRAGASAQDAGAPSRAGASAQDAGEPSRAGASAQEQEDAGEPSGDAASAEDTCDGGRYPATRMCPGGPFAFSRLDSGAATVSALVGRWQVCEGTGFRWGPENAQAGIEFTSDGKFYLLGEDAQGALRRVVGLRTTGSYTPGEAQDQDLNIYFQFPEGGGAGFFPSFDAQQAHFHAGGDSGFESNYVRVAPGADNVPGVVAPATCGPVDVGGMLDGSSMCDASAHVCPGGPFAFASLESQSATLQALVGRWQVCEGTGFRWGPEDAHRGIEFTSDGKFFLLGVDAQGALQRAVGGLRFTGSYKMGEPEDMNVYFNFPEGGGAYFYPSFDAQQAHLHAGGDSGFDSNYVRVAPGAGSVPGVNPPGVCN